MEVSDQSGKAAAFYRLIYLTALVSLVFPGPLIILMRGEFLRPSRGLVELIALIALVVWRFVYVARHPDALASPPGRPVTALIRTAGVVLMVVGILSWVGQLFVPALTHLILNGRHEGDAGALHLVVFLMLYAVSRATFYGILLFELGRWISRLADRINFEPKRWVVQVAIAGALGLVVLAVIARIQVYGAHDRMVAQCAIPSIPIVKKQLSEMPPSVLISEDDVLRRYGGMSMRAGFLAGAARLPFVEECRVGNCWKLTPLSPGSRWSPERDTIDRPISPIELRLASVTTKERQWGAELLQLRYEVRTTDTHQVLAEAFEWMYAWGLWNRRGFMGGDERREACGYAQAKPHDFRLNSTGPVPDGYAAADVRLILSVVPEDLHPPGAAKTAADL